MRRWVWLGVLCACILPVNAFAFECKTTNDDARVSLFWPTRQIEYGIRLDSGLDPETVQKGFDVWSNVLCTDLELLYVGLVAASNPISQVYAVKEGWATGVRGGRDPDAVAITVTTQGSRSGEVVRADIEVNEDLYRFGDGVACSDIESYDLQAVIAHEVGHVLGLDHSAELTGSPADDPTMGPVILECEVDKRDLENDDVQGICFLYPRGGETNRCGGLVDQDEYIGNSAFSCRDVRLGDGGGLGWGWLFVTLLYTRGGRWAPCGGRRSEG